MLLELKQCTVNISFYLSMNKVSDEKIVLTYLVLWYHDPYFSHILNDRYNSCAVAIFFLAEFPKEKNQNQNKTKKPTKKPHKKPGNKHDCCRITFCTTKLQWEESSCPKKQESSPTFLLATSHILTMFNRNILGASLKARLSPISAGMTIPPGLSHTTVEI